MLPVQVTKLFVLLALACGREKCFAREALPVCSFTLLSLAIFSTCFEVIKSVAFCSRI